MMGKQIKAITCPKCGYNHKANLDNERYHCKNCNTDYSLNNDQVNINNSPDRPQAKSPLDAVNISKNKTSVSIISAIIGLLFVVMIINSITSKSTPKNDNSNTRFSNNDLPTSDKNSIISQQSGAILKDNMK
ncbi:hypothetical protein RHO13_01435 [Orbus wheelerorum]|uniref:hypothetical protein n=2 Tax=Orbus wheelerorum TaxID=3074111 RepID=UPI00370DCD3C